MVSLIWGNGSYFSITLKSSFLCLLSVYRSTVLDCVLTYILVLIGGLILEELNFYCIIQVMCYTSECTYMFDWAFIFRACGEQTSSEVSSLGALHFSFLCRQHMSLGLELNNLSRLASSRPLWLATCLQLPSAVVTYSHTGFYRSTRVLMASQALYSLSHLSSF